MRCRTRSAATLLTILAGTSFTAATRAGVDETRWLSPVDGRWDDDLWSGGVPTRFTDVVIDATGAAYTIRAASSENQVRGRIVTLDSDDATLIFDGADNGLPGDVLINIPRLVLRRGAFIVDNAQFFGTDVILEGADVRFGDVSFGNNALIAGLAHTQDTDFDIQMFDLSFLQTDLATTGDASGRVSVRYSVDEEVTTELSTNLSGRGWVSVFDSRANDDSHLLIAEDVTVSGWSVGGGRVTNHGSILSDRFGPGIELAADLFANHGSILAEGEGVEWESLLVNHGQIRAGLGGTLAGGVLDNRGDLRLDPSAYLSSVTANGSVDNTGDILLLGNSELATGRLVNSGTIEVQGALLRTGFRLTAFDTNGEITFENTGSILVRNNGTLLAHNTRLDLLGDITLQSGGQVAFGSLDLAGETLADFDRFGGRFLVGADGEISNGAIDFAGRSDAFVAQPLGTSRNPPLAGPLSTAFRDITLSNGSLGGARFTFGDNTTLSNIDLDLSAGRASVVGGVSFDGRMFTTDGGPLELWVGEGTLTLEQGASIDAPYTEVEIGFLGGTVINRSDLEFGGERLSFLRGPGLFTNAGSFATSGRFEFNDLSSFLNVGEIRSLEGGEIFVTGADQFANLGTLVVDRGGLFARTQNGSNLFEMTISEIGTVDRHRDSVIHLLNGRLDLEGQTIVFDPDAGERGGAFHGLFMAREFRNGQLGVEDGGVRIGFGLGAGRLDDVALRGTVEIAHDGGFFGNVVGLNLDIGAGVDMTGSTLLFSYAEAQNRANVTFESEIDADLRVEFTPGTQNAREYIYFNRDGTLRIGEGRSLTGERFAFGRDTERVINDGLIAVDGASGAVLGRQRGFGIVWDSDFEVVNNGVIGVGEGSALSVYGDSLVNHGTVTVNAGSVLGISAPLDNRGTVSVSGEGSRVRFFGATPVALGDFTLADGAAAEYATDIELRHITGLTRVGETTVRFERTLDLQTGTLGLANAGGVIEMDGGEVRNGIVDVSGGAGPIRFVDQGGFERADDPIREFLAFRHNALTDLQVVGGTAVLDTQVLLRGVGFVSNVENLGVLAAVGGASIGGDFTLGDSSLLVITANANASGIRVDRFDVGGTASLGGSVVIDFEIESGTDVTAFGGLYRFLDAGAFTGEFLEIEFRGIDAGLISLAGDGAFRIVPAPSTGALLLLAACGVRRRGRA